MGIASWYKAGVQNKITASGERYNPNSLTAASREFPFGTELKVTNLANERNVTVTVNDRGPYKGKRVIDLSVEAARELGMKRAGLAPVCVQKIIKDSDREQ
jgi:rare lipoprotein A